MNNPMQETGFKQTDGMMHGGRIVLSLKKSITWDRCPELRRQLEKKIQEGRAEIILDMNKVDHLDSAALELLIDMHDELMQQGGALKIVSLNEICRDILLATRIINILYVYKDINEAVAHKKT